MINRLKGVAAMLLAVLVFTPALQAQELVLTAPPRETPKAGAELYGPLAKHLSKLLGTPVTYQHPGNWLKYQQNMRNDVYDIVFDGPHFASWRMAHLGHRMVAKLPGSLQFVILVRADDDEVKHLDDLVAHKVCGIPPPNLATMTVVAQYPNPVRQPVIKGVPGGFPKVFAAFEAGQCRAAVLRTNFYEKKLTDAQRASVKVLFKSKPLPNQAISVSKRISEDQRARLAVSLTKEEAGIRATKPILDRFGGKSSAFLPAADAEWLGHNAFLEGVVFGW